MSDEQMRDDELEVEILEEIEQARGERDWRGAWGLAEELDEQACERIRAGLVEDFGVVTCPCCGGAGGWSGTQMVGHVEVDADADCMVCDCLGMLSGEELAAHEREVERHQHEWDAWVDELERDYHAA